MLRKLTALAAGVTAGLIVLSALAQTTPPKKKKSKKHKHTTTAPAASATAAPAATATASPDLYSPPPAEAETAAPTPSAAPSSEPAAPAADESAPAPSGDTEAAKPKDTGPSSALPPISAALLVGWGYNVAAKLGFGVRAGYTLPFHVYVGATFVYHLGESEDGATAKFLYPGGEAGYELTFGPVMVRPYVGAGPLMLQESLPPASASAMYFAFWPGVTAAYTITPNFFAGLDARYLISSYEIFGLFGTVGARF